MLRKYRLEKVVNETIIIGTLQYVKSAQPEAQNAEKNNIH